MGDFDVHKINRRYERSIERLEESEIPKEDKNLILEFRDYAQSNGMTKTRILKYVNTLCKFKGWLHIQYEKAKKENIMKLIRIIENEDLSDWTKHDYKVILKRFYKWMNGDEEYPNSVKWIKTSFKKNHQKLPEDLISAEDVNRMIQVARHSRDKALISLLYESGCRIGEILTMRIKNVVFDEFGARITVKGKTGMRRLRIISSVPYLATWISNHDESDNLEAPLWIPVGAHKRQGAVKYPAIRKLIDKLGKKAGLKKRIHPHLFRHSRATSLANHMTDAQMNQYFGWVQGSGMPSTYVHLSGKDVDGTILKLNGIVVEDEQEKNNYSAKKCQRCEKMNPPEGKFCVRCGAPLDLETIQKVEEKRKRMDDLMSNLMRDPETQRFLLNKMRQMRLETPINS